MDTNIEELELVNAIDEAVSTAEAISFLVKRGLWKRAAEKAKLLKAMTEMMAAMDK